MTRFTKHGIEFDLLRNDGVWVLRNVSTGEDYPNWCDDGTFAEMRDRLDSIWRNKTPEEFRRAFTQ